VPAPGQKCQNAKRPPEQRPWLTSEFVDGGDHFGSEPGATEQMKNEFDRTVMKTIGDNRDLGALAWVNRGRPDA
jgi:hypothetical protein